MENGYASNACIMSKDRLRSELGRFGICEKYFIPTQPPRKGRAGIDLIIIVNQFVLMSIQS
jgi:hypothetical protein